MYSELITHGLASHSRIIRQRCGAPVCLLPSQYYSQELLHRFEHHPYERGGQGPRRGGGVEAVPALRQAGTGGPGRRGPGADPETRRPPVAPEKDGRPRRSGSEVNGVSCCRRRRRCWTADPRGRAVRRPQREPGRDLEASRQLCREAAPQETDTK